MKLYKAPPGKVRLLETPIVPPGSPELSKGDVVTFSKTDGMYAICFIHNVRVYPGCSTEVEIITNNEFKRKNT